MRGRVRLALIDTLYLQDYVDNNSLLRRSKMASKLVMEAYKYQASPAHRQEKLGGKMARRSTERQTLAVASATAGPAASLQYSMTQPAAAAGLEVHQHFAGPSAGLGGPQPPPPASPQPPAQPQLMMPSSMHLHQPPPPPSPSLHAPEPEPQPSHRHSSTPGYGHAAYAPSGAMSASGRPQEATLAGPYVPTGGGGDWR